MFQGGLGGWGLPWQPHRDELRIFPPGRSWPMESGKVGEGARGYLRGGRERWGGGWWVGRAWDEWTVLGEAVI